MWKHATDRFSLDPCLQTCPSCDMDFYPSVRFVNGLCPECAREKDLEEAAEEEMADAMENDNNQQGEKQ